MNTSTNGKDTPLYTRIFIGFLLGAIGGVTCHFTMVAFPGWNAPLESAIKLVIEPAGQIFLRMLFMIVVPLVFTTLSLGVFGLGDLRSLGRIGSWTMAYFLLVTSLAVILGLFVVNTLRPGDHMSADVQERLLQEYGSQEATQKKSLSIEYLVNIVPANPIRAAANGEMLAVIFTALMAGIGLSVIDREDAMPVVRVLRGAEKVLAAIIRIAMKLAPFGVFALIFTSTSRFGWELLAQLIYYAGTVLLGLLLFQFGGYALLIRFLGGMNPWVFFKKIRAVIITSFSTSSSNATLPTTIKTAQDELKLDPSVTGFVLPLGATLNMNGTALFEGVTVVFLAQVFGVHLDLGQQLLVIVLSTLAAIGTAGVPSGSIPLLVMVLETVGVPGLSVGLILGIDRFLDMSRTVLNVTGDLSAAVFISRLERRRSRNPEKEGQSQSVAPCDSGAVLPTTDALDS